MQIALGFWMLLFLLLAPLAQAGNPAPIVPQKPAATSGSRTSESRLFPNLHFFPLLFAETDPAQHEQSGEALWPLFEWRRDLTTSARLLALHPFFSTGADASGHDRFWDIFYPLAGSRTTLSRTAPADSTAGRWVFPIYFHKVSRDNHRRRIKTTFFPLLFSGASDPPHAAYFIVFPFFWKIDPGSAYALPLQEREAGRSLAIWPFYGTFRHMFGADELHFALWPLWVGSRRGPNYTTTLFWPFFSRTRGPEINAWRVWPLVSVKRHEGVGNQVTWLWPLGYHIRRRAEGAKPRLDFDAFLPLFLKGTFGRYHIQYYFPIYGSAERPGQRSVAWLWPLFIKTRHANPDWTQFRLLYIVANVRRGAGTSQTALFPLFSHGTQPDHRRTFVLFPFYTRRFDRDLNGRDFSRQYLFPFLINERWTERSGALIKHRRALLPFYRTIERGDGSREFSWPHLWWYTEQQGIDRNWAPLWTLYRSTDDGHGTREQRLFGRLWRQREIAGIGSEREINFLIGRWHKPAHSAARWSLFGFSF